MPNISNVKKQQRERTTWKSTTTRLFKQQSLEDNHNKITQDTPGHHPQDATKDFCHRNLRDKQHLTNTEADDLHKGHNADQEDRKARLFEDKNKQWAEKLRKKHEERRPWRSGEQEEQKHYSYIHNVSIAFIPQIWIIIKNF